MRKPGSPLEWQIDLVARSINYALFNYCGQDPPESWKPDLQGGCATGAFLAFDIFTKFGHEAFVASGSYGGGIHAFCLVRPDLCKFYIVDPTFAQFDYGRPYVWEEMNGRIEALRVDNPSHYRIKRCSKTRKYIIGDVFKYWRNQHPEPHATRLKPRLLDEVGPQLTKIQGSE